MRFSILDRANATTDLSESETLRGVLDHAQQVESLGFQRFFVAEHHAVPGIPGSQPAMLATAVGAATSSIRVGTAGIMLPNHAPIIAAEQINTLAALYPERIDAGIGSSVGFTAPVRNALRQEDAAAAKKRYPDDLDELLTFLRGEAPVTARPISESAPVWLLAGFRSLHLAAQRGLGVIVGGPSIESMADGIRQYRENFQPSALLDAPEVIVSLNLAVAETEGKARDLMLPEAWAQSKARSTGSFDALQPVENLDESTLTSQERHRVAQTLAMGIYGTPAQVRERMSELARLTGADEVLATGGMSDLEGRARSEEILADLGAK